jgi:hypothetical protein
MVQVVEITEVRVLTLYLALLHQLEAALALAIILVNKLVVMVARAVAVAQIRAFLVAQATHRVPPQAKEIMVAHHQMLQLLMAQAVAVVQVRLALLALLGLVLLVVLAQPHQLVAHL